MVNVLICRTILWAQINTQKSTNNLMSSFGLIEKNMELSPIYQAVLKVYLFVIYEINPIAPIKSYLQFQICVFLNLQFCSWLWPIIGRTEDSETRGPQSKYWVREIKKKRIIPMRGFCCSYCLISNYNRKDHIRIFSTSKLLSRWSKHP